MPHASVIAATGVQAYPRCKKSSRLAARIADRVRSARLPSEASSRRAAEPTVMAALYLSITSVQISPASGEQ
jgi:hypothetical protein